ncbi:hypothetical protein PYW07_016445 [Mythimna separata]|uniref:Uncharacterized protein n=1 Tax=Mythimna separata TaxID=271217 RepID=A0AAD7YLN0_MYTSE|nr:hypothetical protein PYW07_016445 [Mythimna separata]
MNRHIKKSSSSEDDVDMLKAVPRYNCASDVRIYNTFVVSCIVAQRLWRRKCSIRVACGAGVRPALPAPAPRLSVAMQTRVSSATNALQTRCKLNTVAHCT